MNHAKVECKTPQGRTLATVTIYALSKESDALRVLSADEANSHGEAPVQLKERGRYEYRIEEPGYVLQESRGISHSAIGDGRMGRIEPQDFCGQLSLILLKPGDTNPLAYGTVEVRSYKLTYRDDYRGMLTDISERYAGLLLDCRAPTQLKLDTLWQKDAHLPEQQLEFLRATLESSAFRGAVDQVLHNPHRLLESEREQREITRPFKAGKDFSRQVAQAAQRVAVPHGHPLHAIAASLPAKVMVTTRRDFLDTPENRFAKQVLVEFRDFLVALTTYLERKPSPENLRLKREAARLRGSLESQLSRGFFPEVSAPTTLPLGSPVLQCKAGYRELLRFWLQFHTSAQVSWEGGQDVYQAGARNVATLYEYWLYFQLEALFREKFAATAPLHSIVLDKGTPPKLLLQRGKELRATEGLTHAATGRKLSARFQFNRKFARNKENDHTKPGSWTRGVQPDYTISLWPTEFTEAQAEANELLVHVHFDAKYRVDNLGALLADETDEDAFCEAPDNATAAKYTDLLKMHAYRDAIRRTAGAYVLYPGNPDGGNKEFQGFHEVLPGLGAFAISPDKDGKPKGIVKLSEFLDKVIEHLAHRTTARERTTYHVREAYRTKEDPAAYGSVRLQESDTYGTTSYRALPPAEEIVLVAWYQNDAQLALAQHDEGFLYIRLGDRPGAFHVPPKLALARRALLRTHRGIVAPGAFLIREPGYDVYTREQLRRKLEKHTPKALVAAWQNTAQPDDSENIYALFQVKPDPDSAPISWDGDKLMDLIEAYETDHRNKLVTNVGRRSPDPRLLSLDKLLQAQR
ncbi:MAG: DUF2357 domain-containing protein [Armatimonadetes bacterium]|nr:DUF2357 domain-containing protein [Armatimonadota bacterium]